MNRINNLSSIFHLIIITIFLLSLSGCGYKANPYYQEKAPQGDKNIEFIIQNQNMDDNESVDKQ
ncbi:hypothetical protein [Sulfurimonas sp.]|uniref:hypothetical protein n=1 Tax=Sulfurimonas sp. TaxID=2022749 RepID=UPI0025DFCABA|nr:hypothetical protein [Sulfurimonas sp.]MDD5158080.1 hypothetical protein [Sulfurimonas sp.]